MPLCPHGQVTSGQHAARVAHVREEAATRLRVRQGGHASGQELHAGVSGCQPPRHARILRRHAWPTRVDEVSIVIKPICCLDALNIWIPTNSIENSIAFSTQEFMRCLP